MKFVTVKFTKPVFGGEVLGRVDGKGKIVLAWNALPGETAEVGIIKNKRTLLKGIATKIIDPSEDRIDPVEKHYLSCSPWQILDPHKEDEYKIQIAKEAYLKLGNIEIPNLTITSPKEHYHYRNKMEFGFVDTDHGLSLSFYERGRHQKTAIRGCRLAPDKTNDIANQIGDWLSIAGFQEADLKSLIIRSNLKGQSIVGVFVKNRRPLPPPPKLHNGLIGLHVFFSDPKSPASLQGKTLLSIGETSLTIELLGQPFSFGLMSFFQVHVPLFEKTLLAIKNAIPHTNKLVDFYSGVGAIGLSLSNNADEVILVENNAEAVEFAQKNIADLGLTNAQAILSESEKMLELIEEESSIIFDPPRAGLHKKIIERVLNHPPKTIVYLSCNVSTHARDIELLSQKYDLVSLELMNFFPRTPHIESLAILTRKTS